MLKSVETRLLSVCLPASAAMLLITGCQPWSKKAQAPSETAIRAIWVTRWDYKSERDIAEIMNNCRSAGFNTVLFQVRGNGTALYRSQLEPWAKELGGRDPGFDPLAVACDEARKRKLSIHAWANILPGWRGKNPPADPRQLYNARPDWFWRDAQGRRQPLGWYNSLNPCYPEVRRYLCDLMSEIVSGYDIHGLHMDYIRFPNEWNDSYPQDARVPDYPRDPRTLAMFRQTTGQTPESDPRSWDRWRTGQVTQLVRDIRASIKRIKPDIQLSAAVGRAPGRARDEHFQDSPQWLTENLLDAVYPMNYERTVRGFTQYVDHWARMRPRIPVVMGIMFDEAEGRIVGEQIKQTLASGSNFAAFAYNSMFERRDARGRMKRDKQSAARAALRREVVPVIRRHRKATSRERLAAR